MTKYNFIVSIAAAILLLFTANSARAQCGPDGRQPCPPTTPTTPTTPKTPTAKKTTTKPKVTKPPVVKKTQTNTSLKSKLIGKWRISEGSTEVTYSSNSTGKISEDGKVCVTFTYTLKGNILVEKSKPTGQCQYYEASENTYKIEINGDDLTYFLKLDDGTFTDDPGTWTRIK